MSIRKRGEEHNQICSILLLEFMLIKAFQTWRLSLGQVYIMRPSELRNDCSFHNSAILRRHYFSAMVGSDESSDDQQPVPEPASEVLKDGEELVPGPPDGLPSEQR